MDINENFLRDEFDILSIEQKIEWALDTIRHKETFGMDELNASLSRERRAKGVLLDCKKTIEKQKKEIETLDSIIKYQLYQLKAKDAVIAEARDLIEKLSFYTKRVCGENRLDLDLKRECLEKAKAWLEENK